MNPALYTVVFEDNHEGGVDVEKWCHKWYPDFAYRYIPAYKANWANIGGRFKNMLNLHRSVERDVYLLFIITTAQEPLWDVVCEKYDLKKLYVYETEDFVYNRQYPDSPPRLKTIILKLPKGFSV